jgi:hypothetical protein
MGLGVTLSNKIIQSSYILNSNMVENLREIQVDENNIYWRKLCVSNGKRKKKFYQEKIKQMKKI